MQQAIRTEQKTGSAVRDLGCPISFLKEHLESQFRDGWTWENRGKAWVIDHIYPLSKANLQDRVEFLAAANWQNLQPLTPEENTAKSDTITPEAQALFDRLVQEFSQERGAA